MTDSTDQTSSTPAPSSPPAQTPSLGRIVHVFGSAEDGALEAHAAIVTAVHSATCVNLTVFPKTGGTRSMRSATLGDGEGQWAWPPRV